MFKTHTMTRSGQYATKADLAAHNPSAQAGTVRFATSRIALACALLCTPTLQAQSLYDSRGVLDENVLSSVLLARQASTELDLRRIAIALIEMGLPVDNQSLRLPVRGDALRHPQFESHGFYRLPGQLNSRRDANGGLVAYCPFDFRGSASVRRLAGSTQHSAPDAVAFAVLSPGNNGHFENTCADIRDLAQGNARTPSQTTTRFADDDVILIYTNREFSASGVTRSNFGYTVNGYDDLPLSKDYVVDGQVRLVKNLNQFFRAQSSGDSFVWQPLTPSAIVTQADKNRADFAWLSGAVSIGETSAMRRPNLTGSGFSENSPSVLTLGNQVVDKASAASTGEKASGISFADNNSLLRTYLGQSNRPDRLGQTEFVIRYSAQGGTPLVRDRLRIKEDGQLWLGDVPVSNPSEFATPSNTVLFGSTRIGAGGADSGGSPSLIIGNTLQGQDAILRFYTTSSSNVLELGTTGNTGIASHLLLSPINNVGIGYNPASSGLLAHKLDVNGSGRFMGELIANGRLTATTGTFSGLLTANNGLTATTGTFSGLLTANNGLTVTNGEVTVASLAADGALTATTGTFSGGLTANAGLTVNTAALNANSGLTATTGTFSGLLTANNGLTVTNGGLTVAKGGLTVTNGGLTVTNGGLTVTNGGLTATTGTFSDLLTANNGLTATTGTFSGLLTANNGLTVTNGGLTVTNGGLTVTNGGLTATTGTFSGLLTANNGLTATTGTFSDLLTANNGLTATTGTFSGLLTANNGLTATTGTFSGLLTANGGLTVDGNAVFKGDITVRGRLWVPNVVNLTFNGYTGPDNSTTTEIGSGQFSLNTGDYTINLAQANQHLYSINQSLSSTSSPTFGGINIVTGGVINGYLNGTARDANKLNKILRLKFLKNAGDEAYATAQFDLSQDGMVIESTITVNSTPILNYGTISGVTTVNNPVNHGSIYYANAFTTTDDRTVTAHVNNPNITYNITCTINGSSATTCNVPQTTFTIEATAQRESFLPSNTYNLGPNTTTNTLTQHITQYDTTNYYAGNAATASLADSANRLNSDIQLRLEGNFFNPVDVNLNTGQRQTIKLTSIEGLTRAIAMDQSVNKDSVVEFKQLTVAASGSFGHINTNTLMVHNSAMVKSLLEVLECPDANNCDPDNSGTRSISLNGNSRTASIGNVLINGRDGSVTADSFKGNAATATRLAQDITFTFNGVVSGTGSSGDGFNYTISTNLANDSIESAKLAPGAVTTAKLDDKAVTTAKLDDKAVTTAKLDDKAVTTEKLHPDAVIYAARNLQSTSDMRLKSDISAVNGTSLLQRLSQVLLYGYRFNDDPTQSRKLGVLAQELQPLFPELVGTQTSGPYAGYLFVDYGLLSAVGAAGVGELNRKLDALGLSVRAGGTLQASLPNFVLTDLEGRNAQFKKLQVDELTAKEGKFDKLDAKQFTTERSRSKQLQADTLNSGSTEGYASGAGLQLFSALDDGHYLVQVSASDGSFASASVFVSGGTISVMPIGGNDISITAQMGTVYAVAAGKMLKASWLKTG